jgi:hypothetical protein
MAFTGDDEEEFNDDEHDEDVCNEHIYEQENIDDDDDEHSRSMSSDEDGSYVSPKLATQAGRHISLSLSNLPDNVTKTRGGSVNQDVNTDSNDTSCRSNELAPINRTTVSESVVNDYTMNKKSLAEFSGSIDKLGESAITAHKHQASLNVTTRQDNNDCGMHENPIDPKLQNQSLMDIPSESNNQTSETAETAKSSENCTIRKNPIIEEQQKLVEFEPFEFKMPACVGTPFIRSTSMSKTAETKNFEMVLSERERELEHGLDESNNEDQDEENMLKNALRRQSLFKLKDRLNGKVSRHINEIEQRKLSPYRFCNSPLKKIKKSKAELQVSSGHVSKKHASPLRIPSIFNRKAITETPTEQYIINSKSKYISDGKLSKTIASCILERKAKAGSKSSNGGGDNSPLIVRAANQIYRKMNRNRSVKRLNQTTLSSYTARSNLSAIAENVSLTNSYNHGDSSMNRTNVHNTSGSFASPTSTRSHILFSTELKCSTESIDL